MSPPETVGLGRLAQLAQPITLQKLAALGKWVDAHPEKLKMTHDEFTALLADASKPREMPAGGRGGGVPR